VHVPTSISYRQGDIIGYVIANKHDTIEVPDGTEPFVVSIPAEPAGAIHGNLTNDDGSPFLNRVYARVIAIKEPPRRELLHSLDSARSNSGQYLLSPVPLEGTYRVMAMFESRFAVSDEITVDAEHPIHTANLRFAKGITLAGSIVGPDDKPAAGIEVQLLVNILDRTSHGNTITTDREGKFRFDQIDPDLPASFTLHIKPGQTTRAHVLNKFTPNATPMEIKLEPGLSARGKIIDDSTGKPVAHKRISLDPVTYGIATYPWSIMTTADANGEFSFANLEPTQYRIRVDNSYPPGTTITKNANGSTTYHYPPNHTEPKLEAGQEDVCEVRVMLPPSD